MAKKFEYSTFYTEDNVSSKSFDRDTSFFKPPRAAEGDGDTKKQPDYAGGRTARKPTADPDLDYVNSGKGSGSKSWN
jgi:hypothetical protein